MSRNLAFIQIKAEMIGQDKDWRKGSMLAQEKTIFVQRKTLK